MQEYICSTGLLDCESDIINALIEQQGWRDQPIADCIQAVRSYVLENIVFTFRGRGIRPASETLSSGYGNSIERCAVAMALLRSLDISCRLCACLADVAAVHQLLGEPPNHKEQQLMLGVVEAFDETAWIPLEGLGLDSQLGSAKEPVTVAEFAETELGTFACPEDAWVRYKKTSSWSQRMWLYFVLPKLERSLVSLRN